MSDADPTAGLRALAAAAFFPIDGELALGGLREPVALRRDAWGVPYLEASSLDDLWFAQGVFTAGERLFQLDLTLRAANGRLSEVFGDRTLDDDRFVRTVGFHRAGARLADAWGDESLRMHERFRAGVAAWIEVMPSAPVEYTMLDLRPELPVDVGAWAAAFVYLSWGLSGNALQELLRAWIAGRDGADAAATLLPPVPDDPKLLLIPGGLHGRLFDALARPGGQGSNAWVLAASRTSSGGALLANDPHLEAVQPGVWLEMHLSAPGYRARGVALPWTPGIVLGTTAHHAWGATNVSGDVQDLFLEELADDGLSVRRGDGWSPVIVHSETIGVRGADPVELTVRETSHGPLLDRFPVGEGEVEQVSLDGVGPPGTAVALAWTGLEHAIKPSLATRVAAASSFAEFREAVREVSCPGQNFVYADVDGAIGYACTGVYPVRRAGDGTVPVPAADGEHAWVGTIDPDELPWGVDPARGYLVSANNRPHGDDYPHLIGRDFHPAHRAERIVDELEAHAQFDVASAAALQADTVSPTARRIVERLLGAELAPLTEAQRLGLDLVLGWDGEVGADSAGAALFQVWSDHVARRVVATGPDDELFERYHADREVWHCRVLPELAERALEGDPSATGAVLDALDDAVAELRSRLGGDPTAWRWGALHRVRLAHPLAAIPGLESLFTAVDAEVGGDESTVAQMAFDSREGFDVVVIPSWRAVYDLADLDRSVGVLPAGVSGNPASPHWNDQASMWLAGRTHPLPFTRAAVEDATVSLVRLAPATISG